MSDAPPLSLRHLALWIEPAAFDATVRFYREGLGMAPYWQPDPDNVYLAGNGDNLALHRAVAPRTVSHDASPLDHLGFFVGDAEGVRRWHDRLANAAAALGITIAQPVKTHRDGATSFYLRDPAGNLVQILHVPDAVG